MANSNFVGCSTGMSFGCLPCSILCTNLAPCRNAEGVDALEAGRDHVVDRVAAGPADAEHDDSRLHLPDVLTLQIICHEFAS